ncbi:MAG: hormogonium polysaccharide biosynthesis protein HpsA [Gloeotrichia echinulata IR180]
MSKKRQPVKAIHKLFNKASKQFLSAIKKQIIWLLRTFFTTRRKRSSVNAGFVLPTVVLVSLVLVLVTTAILFRSFDRSKNANNVRVNETVIRTAAPALDRAKAKLDKLFIDPRLPRSTPTDVSLSQVINDNINEYTFGDETQLKLVKDVNGDGSIADDENIKSVWKYPVDTDNNGKFDSFTLYGIYFRTPTSTRARSPLEARAQPMDEGATSGRCVSNVATSADLVGSQGWYKVGGKLKRSIFVYTTTVPITDDLIKIKETFGDDYTKYENFTSNKGFVALEYQQDRERIPLSNNAVVYEDDLEITPGAGINLNGRIFTNGNFLTRKLGSDIRFYLVSSPKSCYYTEENSKIVVAGNVINSRVNETSKGSSASVQVDLFDKNYDVTNLTLSTSTIDDTNKSVPQAVYGNTAAYNDKAYVDRIQRLIDATNTTYPNNTSLPDEVQESINRDLTADPSLDPVKLRNDKLKIYFRKKTRRVPYAEIPFGEDALKYGSVDYKTNSPLQGSGNSLRPVDAWAFPFSPSDGTTATGYAGISVKTNSTKKLYLSATDPLVQLKDGKETLLGDRVLVGNNMPETWYDSSASANKFVASPDQGQLISGREWDNNTNARKRYSQAYQLDNLGVTDRDGFWEKSAAQQPTGPLDVVGGLRVITGAGIYLPNDYNPSTKTFTDTIKTVWPDTMATGVTSQSQGLPNDKTPYLQMRTTVVYHYQDDPYDPKTPTNYQTPIACVSSYYDPTNSTTAMNQSGLPNVRDRTSYRNLTGLPTVPATITTGKSNNGVVYSASSLATTGYTDILKYQAALKYPNGRLVNERLSSALAKITASGNLTLSEQSAVDSAMCALKILDGTIGNPTDAAIPHGAIMETAFLDARQIKAIDQTVGSANYDLGIEFRQPLEIRATVLDLDLLRRKAKNNGEFLFPNSGVIYATRDDALPDQSDADSPDVSATDFRLDPTRRPNGIMLINGSDLSRNSTYQAAEKGLILTSNLPVYIQGDFNKHTKEEFTELNAWGDDFYKRKTLDSDFACRKGQFSSCTTGETWRPATVLADAITVLSSNFKLGYRQDGDYDLNDNYGNYPVGYDLNGINGLETTQITLDEKAIKFDLNFDGDIDDTAINTLDETKIKADINSDGDTTDTSVPITESNIIATVAARLNGFWDNNFVTSRSFTDSDYSTSTSSGTRLDSSYFNNFVTPIQRRVTFSEYVMEICPKLTVTACTPDDWVVGYYPNGDKVKANQLVKALADAKIAIADVLTTSLRADPSDSAIQRYPRRVAFLRYGNGLTVTKNGTALNASPVNNALVLDSDNTPVPLGIVGSGSSLQVRYFPFSNTLKINGTDDYLKYDSTDSTKRPRTKSNSLWFRTSKNLTDDNYDPKYPLKIENTLTGNRPTEQPLLIPVLQLQYPNRTPSDTDALVRSGDATSLNWMQRATATETNLVFAQGNTPERPPVSDFGETNGGLENFVRYLETWDLGTTTINHKAAGSFIQFKRSSYATAPWQTLIYPTSPTPTGLIFGYPQSYQAATANSGRSPFYAAPSRSWGYDVALLTQLPDLFSQRFTAPGLNPPNEFYREVGRDDNWVKTLLCAAQDEDLPGGYDDAAPAYNVTTPTAISYKYAIRSDQRPSTCP